MSPSTPPRNNQFAVNLPKAMWLASTKIDFIELSKTAAKWPRVSETYCFAGVDQEKHHKITNGRSDELDKALVCLQRYPRSAHSNHRACPKLIHRL